LYTAADNFPFVGCIFTCLSINDDSPYYNIELREIHVGGKALRVDPRVFDSKHGTVLDSGTTYAYLPEQAFVAFKDAVRYLPSTSIPFLFFRTGAFTPFPLTRTEIQAFTSIPFLN